MATINPVISGSQDSRGIIVTWANMGDDDTGAPFRQSFYSDKSVQIVAAAFGSATLVIQGSNDGNNYVTLTDPQGSPLSFTSAGLKAVSELTEYIRPATSGGTSTDVTVVMMARGGL